MTVQLDGKESTIRFIDPSREEVRCYPTHPHFSPHQLLTHIHQGNLQQKQPLKLSDARYKRKIKHNLGKLIKMLVQCFYHIYENNIKNSQKYQI